ncbi:hypothetical protein GZH47_33485 (plasmid) [Paenibacillus rhizovicinus]|uniref:Acyl carrier protein n=1 Tax=Paenibacillus rhizovicinus TaxID=2704463 RepID=A0A6C0PB92_9BACL|nr:hypothetical protein [Paenibacillus rhizovicinus]QHW35807.1 hypothetical protein GZH47_33485 [Paenibacillus rhizovicinus]
MSSKRNRILTIITQGCLDPITALDVKTDNIMYVYGGRSEFDDMLSEIEDFFDVDVSLPEDEDIGEMTVQKFVDTVLHLLGGEDEEVAS